MPPRAPQLATSPSSPARAATTSSGSPSTPLAKSRCRAWRRHLPVHLVPAARHRPPRPRRPLALPAGALAELGIVGGVLVLALVGALLWIGFGAWRNAQRRPARALRGPARSLPRLRGLLRVRLVLADRRPRLVFFLASGALVAARCGQLTRQRAAGNGHGEGRRYGLAVAGLAIAWMRRWPWSGRCWSTARSTPATTAAADGNLASAVDHADDGALDRALGGDPLRAARPAGPAHGELPAARPNGWTRRSTAKTKLAPLLPAEQGGARSGERSRGPERTCEAKQLNPLKNVY